MANFGQLLLTSLGIQEQYRAQGGGKLKFKRIGMGSGKYTGNVMALTKLVSENVSVAISKGYAQNNAFTVEGFFSNESLATGFAWREIGVFVEDASGNEVLYCYANAGDSYDYIPATADERYAKNIRVAIAIGNATNITIVEQEGITYVDTLTFGKLRDEVATLHPTKVASGEAIVVENSASLPLAGLTIYGKSTQDGTPSPDAPVEIVSVENPVVTVARKNLLKVTATTRTESGVTVTVNEDGSIICNGTATDTVGVVVSSKLQSGCLTNGETYRLSGCPTGGGKNTYLLQVNGIWAADYGDGVTFVHQSNVVSVIINIMAGTVCNNLTFYPMITVPSMATEWEPYFAQTIELPHTLHGIPVTSGGNYTDSDGQQWISDEVDLERGVYVQRIRVVDIASHGTGVTGLNNGGNGLIISTPYKVKKGGYGLICTHAPFDPIRTFAEGTIYENEGNAVICGNSADTFDTLKEAYGSTTLHYVLATPIETPLTAAEIDAYKALTSNNPCTTILNDSGAGMKAEVIGREFEAFFKTATADHAIESPDHPGCFYRIVGGEVEWSNPPMVAGTEYRTAERYQGHPVYVRMFESVSLDGVGEKTFTIPVGQGVSPFVLEAHGILSDRRVLPYIAASSSVYLTVNDRTVTVALSAGTFKGVSVSVWVKYVKPSTTPLFE